MIDEKPIIKGLQDRIDIFIASNPAEKSSIAVEVVREFIHLLELAAEEQAKRS